MPDSAALQKLNLRDARVTIGSFDGVHRGHQVILQDLVASARKGNAPAVVITFFPHPAVVLGKKTNHYYLTPPDEREVILKSLGVDEVITLPFTRELAELSPEKFLEPLKQHLGMQELWVGYDFAMGKNRAGNTARLAELAVPLEYQLKIIEPIRTGNIVISSSQIRESLVKGEVNIARELLGRNYSFSGKVVAGDGRGKQLGFPTANMDVWEDQLIPRNGIYAGWVWVEGRRYGAAVNIGLRPTFGDDLLHPRVEPNILDFNHEIYGEKIRLEFVKFLRPEIKFEKPDALTARMLQDVADTRKELQYAT